MTNPKTYRGRPGFRSYRDGELGEPLPFVAHRFVGAGSSCVLCFGWRDDPRHWCDEVRAWSLLGLLLFNDPQILPAAAHPPPAATAATATIEMVRLRGDRQRRFLEETSVTRAMVAT